ncbi:DUF397 domain-containing protein [Sphaerisporangium album]|uniref:DUF397 domain-containing protein n=1 Tax=Sphaerisporangium album TaxID=509200 RepID=A0A367FUT0_9ACTN|nr:DUF397 domain-containing protein [Sphaerisporangium album]
MDMSKAEWRKSRRSGAEGGNCVETARNLPGLVAVRDSKVPSGPVLVFAADEWNEFLSSVKSYGI